MKVAWFTNSLMPDVHRHLQIPGAGSGPWMAELLSLLRARADMDLHVITSTHVCPSTSFSADGVTYHLVRHRKPVAPLMSPSLDIAQLADVVHRIDPDVVHIHGSEQQYGLVCQHADIARRTILSVQGIIDAYERKVAGELGWRDRLRATSLLELARGGGVFWQRLAYRLRARSERQVFALCRAFMGRTAWDRAYVAFANPAATYHEVGEVLRAPFYTSRWTLDAAQPFTIFFSNITGPIKGGEVLLKAVALLKARFPQVRLRLAGRVGTRSGYARYMRSCIEDGGLGDCVEQLGYLDADRIVEAMKTSMVFVSASYGDNSPNSLAEAQIMGVPTIATFVGGVPSMSGPDGTLFVPPGEPEMLAAAIASVFEDRALCLRLSGAARALALQRHDRSLIVASLLQAYGATAAASAQTTGAPR